MSAINGVCNNYLALAVKVKHRANAEKPFGWIEEGDENIGMVDKPRRKIYAAKHFRQVIDHRAPLVFIDDRWCGKNNRLNQKRTGEKARPTNVHLHSPSILHSHANRSSSNALSNENHVTKIDIYTLINPCANTITKRQGEACQDDKSVCTELIFPFYKAGWLVIRAEAICRFHFHLHAL